MDVEAYLVVPPACCRLSSLDAGVESCEEAEEKVEEVKSVIGRSHSCSLSFSYFILILGHGNTVHKRFVVLSSRHLYICISPQNIITTYSK